MATASSFFSTEGLIPHGFCLTWRQDVFWTQTIADGFTAIAYFSIPFAIFYFVRHRPGHRFPTTALSFCAFIALCGTTHILEIWTLWFPDYGVLALAKSATAVVSIITAIGLWVKMPYALTLPTHHELERKNAALQESEDRFRSLVESTTDWVWETDVNHCFSWFSSSLESILGIPSSTLLGKRR